MPVYMLIEISEVLDAGTYAEYQQRIPATVEKYGGRYIVRGRPVIPLTGDWNPARVIILEFPSMERMTEWNFSPEYLDLAPLRMRSTRTRAIALKGVAMDKPDEARSRRQGKLSPSGRGSS